MMVLQQEEPKTTYFILSFQVRCMKMIFQHMNL